jgi:hypothetical protein
MLEEPTSLRIEDPGVRALFTEPARFQSWLDYEAALAAAQAELGVIPPDAAREIVRKAKLDFLDLDAVRAGLAKTGHPLVPLVWALDQACEGDAGGYVHWGATTQNVTQTGQLLQARRAHAIFLRQLGTLLDVLAGLAERTKDMLLPGRTHGQHAAARHVRLQGCRVDRRAGAPRGAAGRLRAPRVRRDAGRRRRHARLAGPGRARHPGEDGGAARPGPHAHARRAPSATIRRSTWRCSACSPPPAARSGARSTPS